MKIVILDGYTANPGDLSWSRLEALGELANYDRTSPEEVVERARGCEVVLTNKVLITAEIMDALPEMRYIGVLATGYNVVDVAAARERGIVVTNVPAYSTTSVAQTVFAHILSIAVGVEQYTAGVREGKWTQCKDFCYFEKPIIELWGKTMGIVGLGNIGSTVATIALAMGMKVLAYTSKPQDTLPQGITKADFDTLFSQSDIVTLHCPLTAETHHLVNRDRLALMKPTAMLINTGRGPLVNEQDLADALNERRIYGAGLDVLSQEPPEATNPLLTARNCFITPHIAWASRAARERLVDVIADNVIAYLEGHPQNDVTKV